LFDIIDSGNTLAVLSTCQRQIEGGLMFYEQKGFFNYFSSNNHHFINSFINDSMYKKIVLNLL